MKRVAFLLALLALFGVAPALAQDSFWTAKRTETLMKTLRAASDHGLESGWYGLAEIEKVIASARSGKAPEMSSPVRE